MRKSLANGSDAVRGHMRTTTARLTFNALKNSRMIQANIYVIRMEKKKLQSCVFVRGKNKVRATCRRSLCQSHVATCGRKGNPAVASNSTIKVV